MNVQELLINGVPVLFVVIGLVEAAKRLGIEGKASLVLALVLGLLFALAMQAVVIWPQFSPWLTSIVTGLVLGLSATGIYDLGQRWTTN